MILSNALRIVARRAPSSAAFSTATSRMSQRGFAIAATQQIQSRVQYRYNGEHASGSGSSLRVGGLLAAAAAAAAGASAMAMNDRADCCGIAGVVGASGDAR